MPDIIEDPTVIDPDFDHLAEAKESLAEVIDTGRLDFTAAIMVANTHALISIAQSLDALAFQPEVDEDESIEFKVTDLGAAYRSVIFGDLNEPAKLGNDYYREG